MYLNPEKDNDLLLTVFWRYCIVKIINKNIFQSIFFSCNISNHCDEIQSHYQRAAGIGTVSVVNFLVASRRILSYALSSCTKSESGVLISLNKAFLHIIYTCPFLNLQH